MQNRIVVLAGMLSVLALPAVGQLRRAPDPIKDLPRFDPRSHIVQGEPTRRPWPTTPPSPTPTPTPDSGAFPPELTCPGAEALAASVLEFLNTPSSAPPCSYEDEPVLCNAAATVGAFGAEFQLRARRMRSLALLCRA